ncbi:MAG: hypothetical protein SH820_00560 [Xanthomonadales bacterium]|nr:hypothetical protein [Xanthomonadales bacterium]
MDTSIIEKIIADCNAEHAADHELQDLLAVVAERHGRLANSQEIESATRFVRSYIDQAPYMMKVAWTAAGSIGLESAMERILHVVQSYWEKDDDIIPDNLGMIGLLDDAYCSLCALQAVSDHFQLQTGKYLFPDDLSAANRIMRKIIGEPYASELDKLVMNTMRESGAIDSMKRLASNEKQLDFARQSTIWNHGPAGDMGVKALEGIGLLGD